MHPESSTNKKRYSYEHKKRLYQINLFNLLGGKKVDTIQDEIVSKEKISKLASRLPDTFLRIHCSFIINTERIKERSFDEVLVDDVRLNIGRSYRKELKELLNATA